MASLFDAYWPTPAPANSTDASESKKFQDWTVRHGVPHEAVDSLPAGEDAFTDYANYDRKLTRKPQHENAQRVKVMDPLAPGDRVKVSEASPGSGKHEARKE